MSLQKDAARFWQRTMRLAEAAEDGADDRFIRYTLIPMCAALRPEHNTKTGTMSLDSCKVLYALSARVLPKVTVEIGTFIGTSTSVLKMWAEALFTCDKDNDLWRPEESFQWGAKATTYPRQTSTAMLRDLVGKGLKADLFFFDGRIQMEDLPLIDLLSHERTVYAFDDYEGREKGVINMERLSPSKLRHSVILPCPGTTIAALVPEWMV